MAVTSGWTFLANSLGRVNRTVEVPDQNRLVSAGEVQMTVARRAGERAGEVTVMIAECS